MKNKSFYQIKGGQFKPKLPGHFELKLGGQYHWNLHFVEYS
jgi:hypothetical protein